MSGKFRNLSMRSIATPARELAVGFVGSMPAVLAADGRTITVGRVTLRNDAAPTSGSIAVDHLELTGADYVANDPYLRGDAYKKALTALRAKTETDLTDEQRANMTPKPRAKPKAKAKTD